MADKLRLFVDYSLLFMYGIVGLPLSFIVSYQPNLRPRLGRMDGVRVAFGNKQMTVEAARKNGKSGEPWYICNWMSFTRPFLLSAALSDRPPVLWWLSHGEGRDAVTWCGWDKLLKGRNYWKSRLRCQVYGLMVVSWWLCLYVMWLDMTTTPWWREKVMGYYYLNNRSQCVRLGNAYSPFTTINIGIPPGSILSPQFFLFYVNDLPKVSSKLSAVLYEDDTTLFLTSTAYRSLVEN